MQPQQPYVYVRPRAKVGCLPIAFGVFFGGVMLIGFILASVFGFAFFDWEMGRARREGREHVVDQQKKSIEDASKGTRLPPHMKYHHPFHIEKSYKAFDDQTRESLTIQVSYATNLEFSDYFQGKTRKERSGNVHIHGAKKIECKIDGKTYTLLAKDYVSGIDVTPEFVAMIGWGNNVVLRVDGHAELQLNDDHKQAILDFASRLDPDDGPKPSPYR